MRAYLAAVLAAILAVVAPGCGTDSGSHTGRSTDDASAAHVAAAMTQIGRARRVPAFVAPGPAFDAAARLRGKTIFEIPITSEVPFIAAVEGGMRQAAAKVGARLVVYPNQGKPEQWAQGIRTAIAERADAITLFAQDPRLLAPQIAQAKMAGIPVVVVRTTGEGEPCQTDDSGHAYGAACVPGPFEQAGRLEADWVIVDSRAKADVLVVTSNDARSTVPLTRGLMDEFHRLCPGLRPAVRGRPDPAMGHELRGEVQSALVRDPGIDYVIPIYDSMSQYAVPAIKRAGGREPGEDRDLQRHALRPQADSGRRRRADGRRRGLRVGRMGDDGSDVPGRRRRTRGPQRAHAPARVRPRQRRRGGDATCGSTRGTATPMWPDTSGCGASAR